MGYGTNDIGCCCTPTPTPTTTCTNAHSCPSNPINNTLTVTATTYFPGGLTATHTTDIDSVVNGASSWINGGFSTTTPGWTAIGSYTFPACPGGCNTPLPCNTGQTFKMAHVLVCGPVTGITHIMGSFVLALFDNSTGCPTSSSSNSSWQGISLDFVGGLVQSCSPFLYSGNHDYTQGSSSSLIPAPCGVGGGCPDADPVFVAWSP